MKILVINTWYYPNLQGGAEHSTKLLAENLVASGQEVAVFCVDNHENGMKKEVLNKVKVYRSDGEKYNLYRSYFEKRSLREKLFDKYHEVINDSILPIFRNVLEDFQPDIVHCNCISGVSLKIFPELKKRNIPVVLTLRNYFLLYPFDRNIFPIECFDKLLKRIYMRVCRYYTRGIQAVTAPSEFTLNEHLKNDFFKYALVKECVPNSVAFDMADVEKTVAQKKQRTGNHIKFLYVGWITEEKGINNLLEAFRMLEDENIELTICGSGYLEDSVRKAETKDGRIHYMGKLCPEKLADVYEKADVLVVPSIWEEPFGRVVIEGNQHGLPVICSDRGGIPEIIQKMRSGVIYNGDSIENLLGAMQEMLDRQSYTRYYKGIIDNMHFYSIHKQVESFLDIYCRCM